MKISKEVKRSGVCSEPKSFLKNHTVDVRERAVSSPEERSSSCPGIKSGHLMKTKSPSQDHLLEAEGPWLLPLFESKNTKEAKIRNRYEVYTGL